MTGRAKTTPVMASAALSGPSGSRKSGRGSHGGGIVEHAFRRLSPAACGRHRSWKREVSLDQGRSDRPVKALHAADDPQALELGTNGAGHGAEFLLVGYQHGTNVRLGDRYRRLQSENRGGRGRTREVVNKSSTAGVGTECEHAWSTSRFGVLVLAA